MILKYHGVTPLSRTRKKYRVLHETVEQLAGYYKTAEPKLYLSENTNPNAFATGRSERKGAIVVTSGLIDLLDEHELRGVISHEFAHIVNRDILIGTISATLASSISLICDQLRWILFFGPSRRNGKKSGGAAALLLTIITPIAASITQLAISRTREYQADLSGSKSLGSSLELVEALKKLSEYYDEQEIRAHSTLHASLASLYFIYPFRDQRTLGLFSTHPPFKKRIQKLEKLIK